MCIVNRVFSKEKNNEHREEGDNSKIIDTSPFVLDFENSGGIITDTEYEVEVETPVNFISDNKEIKK